MSTIMKALFTRCGDPIPMRVDKRDYLFQENPGGDFVAIVDSEEHVSYLLQTGNFEVYDPKAKKPVKKPDKKPVKQPEPEKKVLDKQ